MTFPKAGRRSCSSSGGDGLLEGAVEAGSTGSHKTAGESSGAASDGDAWRGGGRWMFNVNHRHGIFEGNTMLNFAGE